MTKDVADSLGHSAEVGLGHPVNYTLVDLGDICFTVHFLFMWVVHVVERIRQSWLSLWDHHHRRGVTWHLHRGATLS